MPITISKSKYLAGVQCLKRLFLLVHQPELGSGKTVADFALLDQGRQAGKLAQQLFPGGVEVRTGNLEEAIRTTQELIANPEVPAIFEAAFEHDGVFVRVDILQRRRDGRWRLIEVKSSASMKEEHLEDVAIQYRAVSKSALDVASCHLAIVNRQYVFPGGDIDPWRFFRIRNLTRKVQSLQPKLVFQLRSEFRVLAMEAPPDLPTGKHCVQPIVCEFFDHCNVPRPADHIAYLPYLHASAAEELEELGVEAADAALVDPGTNRMPQSNAPRSLCVLRHRREHTGLAAGPSGCGTLLAQNAGQPELARAGLVEAISADQGSVSVCCDQSFISVTRSCKLSPRCEATSDERSAGNLHATFCGSRGAGDCPRPPSGDSRWCHGGPTRARSWKRRTQPRKTYSLSGLLLGERRFIVN